MAKIQGVSTAHVIVSIAFTSSIIKQRKAARYSTFPVGLAYFARQEN